MAWRHYASPDWAGHANTMRIMSKPTRRRRDARATWAVGCDLGGTTLRVLARDGAGRTRRLRRGASPCRPAYLVRAALRRWRLRPDVGALVVASRGVWTPAERRAAAAALRGLARRVRVISDVEAARDGALGDAPGMLLLAGTGSMALGRDGRGRSAARAGSARSSATRARRSGSGGTGCPSRGAAPASSRYAGSPSAPTRWRGWLRWRRRYCGRRGAVIPSRAPSWRARRRRWRSWWPISRRGSASARPSR